MLKLRTLKMFTASLVLSAMTGPAIAHYQLPEGTQAIHIAEEGSECIPNRFNEERLTVSATTQQILECVTDEEWNETWQIKPDKQHFHGQWKIITASMGNKVIKLYSKKLTTREFFLSFIYFSLYYKIVKNKQ